MNPTLIMKHTIILRFFAIILSLSAMTQRVNAGFVQRVDFPQRWADAAGQCLKDAPTETIQQYVLGDVTSASRAARLLALCYYTEAGLFVDGQFDATAIENFLTNLIGSRYELEMLQQVFREAADAGNAAVGEDDVKAFAYHAVLSRPASKQLIASIFSTFIGR